MISIARAAAVSGFLLAYSSNAFATPIDLFATLSGAGESPPNSSLGTGFAEVEYDPAAHTLGLNVTFSGLSSNDIAAHIHCCTTDPFTGTAGVATTVPAFVGFPLGVTAGTFNNLASPYDLTVDAFWNPAFLALHGGTAAGAEAFFAAGLVNGTEYFNIHTENFRSGEIPGFLRVPEPPAAVLFAAAFVSLLGLIRMGRRA